MDGHSLNYLKTYTRLEIISGSIAQFESSDSAYDDFDEME
jgi:hypothetical protein